MYKSSGQIANSWCRSKLCKNHTGCGFFETGAHINTNLINCVAHFIWAIKRSRHSSKSSLQSFLYRYSVGTVVYTEWLGYWPSPQRKKIGHLDLHILFLYSNGQGHNTALVFLHYCVVSMFVVFSKKIVLPCTIWNTTVGLFVMFDWQMDNESLMKHLMTTDSQYLLHTFLKRTKWKSY